MDNEISSIFQQCCRYRILLGCFVVSIFFNKFHIFYFDVGYLNVIHWHFLCLAYSIYVLLFWPGLCHSFPFNLHVLFYLVQIFQRHFKFLIDPVHFRFLNFYFYGFVYFSIWLCSYPWILSFCFFLIEKTFFSLSLDILCFVRLSWQFLRYREYSFFWFITLIHIFIVVIKVSG